MNLCQSFDYKLEKAPKYEIDETGSGTIKRYTFENGVKFYEYTSHFTFGEMPFLHVTSGPDPETGKVKKAEGFVAIGQYSKGFVAIGQFANGYFTIAQFGTARVAGVGQFIAAPFAVSQFALAFAALGQVGAAATGIFQMGVTLYGGIGQKIIDLSSWIF